MANGQPCPSTHGGSGYHPQTRVSPDGKLYCPLCGTEMDPTLFLRGQARYIPGAPIKPHKKPLLQRVFPFLFWN
jgi:hypothetical protein